MKTFCFYYDRFDTATTSIALDKIGVDHIILCHSERQKKMFDLTGVCKRDVIVTGNPKGLSKQRNYALDMMEDGERAVFCSDDYKQSYTIGPSGSTDGKERIDGTEEDMKFRNKCDLDTLYSEIPSLIEKAEKLGVHLVGFANNRNPFFNKKKYSTKKLVDGRFYLLRKTHLRFDDDIQSIDDYGFTIKNLETFGKVLVHNRMCAEFERYKKGGFGSELQRSSQKDREIDILGEKYPKYCKITTKNGMKHIKIK